MRSTKLLAISLILSFLFVNQAKPFLKRQGRDIVDSNGQKILLRGIGLGGWLVPEGYQLHVPGFGSPSSIRNKIIDLIGQENTDQFYQIYRNNYVAEQDIQKIASWGFNSIRLPFNYRLLTPEDQPGVYLEEGFQIIDNLLNWCEANQLYLILDMHCAPGGQNKDNISDADGIQARLWTEPANQDRTVEIWKKIAERYADKKWIGGYDLLNEPVLPSGYINTNLRALYMRITRAIREVDSNHLIFIEGNWYANDFTSLTPPWDTNLVYSFHKYKNVNNQGSIQGFLNIRNMYSVPLWMGESGENSNPWFCDSVRLLETNDIGWCWWTHKKIETITSPYSSPISDNYQSVLDYWNGTYPKPSVEFAKNALFEMAENLQLNKCDFRPGVLDALFRSDYNSKFLPFKEHHLPGTINCVDYDFGNFGVAYFDKDYQQTGGFGSGEQWNKGWKYRNDGVDIELCDDAEGSEYNVGWIENGEWLLYSVMVDKTGQYDIEFRVSSPSNNGKLQLFLNNTALTNIVSVPNTGGWKNWQTITLKDISLAAGNSGLKLLFLTGGLNINYLRFILKSSSVKEGSLFEPVQEGFFLTQNYPNPFNNETKFSYHLPEDCFVSFKIFNSSGQIVTTLANDFQNAGWHRAAWNNMVEENSGGELSSGFYFCKIEASSNNSRYSDLKKMLYLK